MIPRRAVGLSERDGFHVIELDSGDELVARALILALGVQYRRLPISGLVDYGGLGVAYATDSAREQLRPGDDAVVVGGANSAGQAALALAAGALVVLIGATPFTDWLAERIELDADGFVLTGPALGTGLRDQEPWNRLGRDLFLLETSLPGVFAVGDVRAGGRMAAPAVGQGGIAVRLAAEHLACTTTLPTA